MVLDINGWIYQEQVFKSGYINIHNYIPVGQYKKSRRKMLVKLLMVLSDNYYHPTKELMKYLKINNRHYISMLIGYLRDMPGIEIKRIYKGYRLDTNIKILY